MKVYIIRGAPGTGKTTKASKIMDNNQDAVHCSADNYFYEVAELNGTSYLEEFNGRLVGKAHQFCWGAFIHALVVMGEKNNHRRQHQHIQVGIRELCSPR